jgi:site-specific recombinase XerD
MPRESSPYKQVLNKDKEPVFYEIKEFILYLMGEKMLSTNTAKSYETDLNKYCEYLKKYRNINDVIDVEKEDVEAYLGMLKKNGFTASSIARKLTSIKKFHAFCVNENGKINVTIKYDDTFTDSETSFTFDAATGTGSQNQ